MRSALGQARSAAGRTFPNPAVGAVVFRAARVLGRGATTPPGGPHAEVGALGSALKRFGPRAVRGASMAVTLEPCCFTGRTGPCTQAIIDAGIARVYVGCRDPHARVNGRGIRKLRAAGIAVEVGVLESQCRRHHRGFFAVCGRGRPFVSLKLATSLDARIATASGESRWISGPESRRWVHGMRARSDAVMVGSGTALADDPELTARRDGRIIHRPVRVLVDSRLRLGAQAKLYQGLLPAPGAEAAEFQTWVLCGGRAPGRRAVAAQGARLIDVPGKPGHLDLHAGLEALAEAGLTTVLVEGGGGLAAALLRAQVVDEIHWIQAPMLLGGDARPALGPLAIDRLAESLRLVDVEVRRRGADVHYSARIESQGKRTS